MARVAAISAERFEALKSCLGPVEGDLSTSQVAGQIAAALEAADEAGALLDALIGARAFGRRAGLSRESAAREVADSTLLDLSDPERRTLADRLTALFDVPTLDLLAHASSLRAEDEYAYCTARILSDLRPMFGPNADVTPSSAIIRHSLKFEVHIDGRIESVVISINDRALEELAASVDRAIAKAESLKEIANQAGLRIVDLEEKH